MRPLCYNYTIKGLVYRCPVVKDTKMAEKITISKTKIVVNRGHKISKSKANQMAKLMATSFEIHDISKLNDISTYKDLAASIIK